MIINVIDNFLPQEVFSKIQDEMLSGDFPWYTNDLKVPNNGSESLLNFQLTHTLYLEYQPRSNHINLIRPIIDRIGPTAILRIKANLTTVTQDIFEYGLHVDGPKFAGYTGIYYINSNNGYTLFENGQKIESVANRFVELDATIKHTGTSSTDTKFRCVLNFNYYKE